MTTGRFARAIAVSSQQRLRLLNDHATAFVKRDVRTVLGVEDVDRFEVFFRLVAAQTGQELNANGLAADIGVSVKTVRR